MEKQNDLKIIGNLSVNTHTKISIIKATYGLRSLETTLKFMLEMFILVDEEVKKKYIEDYNLDKLNTEENI